MKRPVRLLWGIALVGIGIAAYVLADRNVFADSVIATAAVVIVAVIFVVAVWRSER